MASLGCNFIPTLAKGQVKGKVFLVHAMKAYRV
jgi:hypothetical protein